VRRLSSPRAECPPPVRVWRVAVAMQHDRAPVTAGTDTVVAGQEQPTPIRSRSKARAPARPVMMMKGSSQDWKLTTSQIDPIRIEEMPSPPHFHTMPAFIAPLPLAALHGRARAGNVRLSTFLKYRIDRNRSHGRGDRVSGIARGMSITGNDSRCPTPQRPPDPGVIWLRFPGIWHTTDRFGVTFALVDGDIFPIAHRGQFCVLPVVCSSPWLRDPRLK